jgi:hypothetical protein
MVEPVQTSMRLSKGTEILVEGHVSGEARECDHEVPRARIKLRQIGWLDQRGRVWMSFSDWQKAGGPAGSITPLLINPGCD